MPDMTTADGGMKPVGARSLGKVPKDGIIMVPPFSGKVVSGKKPILIKSQNLKISGRDFLLLTRKDALGIIRLSKPKEIGIAEFRRLGDQHLIDEKTRKKFWPERKRFFAYKVVSLKVFSKPIPIEPLKGHYVVVRNVELQAKNLPTMFELGKAEAKDLETFGAWMNVLATKAGPWARSTLRFVQGPSSVIRFIKGVPNKLKVLAGGLPSGGTAEGDDTFPAALDSAIKYGEKTSKIGEKPLAAAIKGTVEYLKELDGVVEALEMVEDDGILNIKKGEGDAESDSS